MLSNYIQLKSFLFLFFKFIITIQNEIAVTICNLNPYDGYSSKEIMNKALSNASTSVNDSRSLLANTEKDNVLIKAVLENRAEKNNLDLYVSGYYLNQMLMFCEFNGVTCGTQDFYAFHDYNYGNCYRFNGNDPNKIESDFVNYPVKQAKKPGSESGLRLEIYTGDQSKFKSLVIRQKKNYQNHLNNYENLF